MGKAGRGYGALVPWYGAKRRVAAEVVRLLGRHRAYVEPFCGSMAVLLAKDPAPHEVANDLHGDLVNLARVVRDPDLAVGLYARVHATLAAEALFREAAESLAAGPAPGFPGPPSADRAYAFFLVSWLGLNGVAGAAVPNRTHARRHSFAGGGTAARFKAAADAVPGWHHRLRAVDVRSGCGIALCEQLGDEDGTAVYADPPYLAKGRGYAHDFAPTDHERLAAALNRFARTRVVVSYYEHPDLGRLYPGWERVRVEGTKAMTRGAAVAPEVLLLNRPAAATRSGLFG